MHDILPFGKHSAQNAARIAVVPCDLLTYPAMEMCSPVSPQALARRFRMVMGDQKMSRSRVSQLTGISRPSLSAKLDGRVEFTYGEILSMIDALGLAWDELLADEEDEGRPRRLRDFRARADRHL